MKSKIIAWTAYLLLIIGIMGRTIAKLTKLPDYPLEFYQTVTIYIGLLLLYINRYRQKERADRIIGGIIFALFALWLVYDGYSLFALHQ